MPIFEFKCVVCDKRYERDEPKPDLTCCDKPVQRVWSVGGVIFKGKGFHSKDYK